MEKRPLIETNNQNENASVKFQLIKSTLSSSTSAKFIAVCGNIPVLTVKDDLHAFLSKFGALNGIWLEEANGKETRQALAFFLTDEGLNNALNGYFLLDSIQDQEELRIEIRRLILKNIMWKINTVLKRINEERSDVIFGRRQQLDFSENDLLLSKFVCDILNRIINVYPYININEGVFSTSTMIERLIKSFPIQVINPIHTQVLKTISIKIFQIGHLEIFGDNYIYQLVQLLDHSNLAMKIDAIFLIYQTFNKHGLDFKINENPSFKSQLTKNELIQGLTSKCLLNGESEQIKNEAAVILGFLLRQQNIETDTRKILIQQLKNGIFGENSSKRKILNFKIFAYLSDKDENVDEITSDNFIALAAEMAKSESEDENVRTQAYELLLLLSEKGGQLEQDVRIAVNDLGFLCMIGNAGLKVEQRVVNQTLKWNNCEQMKIIQQFIQI
ncbi:MAG: hypothetical protein EZS28_025300 [Streblomastix strix]|uniref:Uncharacterized protein n=1 Tax=Streblomastix strix TaxID=222440 RepID=A0A5J4VA11_9EUKA|nr:MAG: hypothetical protein EZS28_025300 [Streblomastix strix]